MRVVFAHQSAVLEGQHGLLFVVRTTRTVLLLLLAGLLPTLAALGLWNQALHGYTQLPGNHTDN